MVEKVIVAVDGGPASDAALTWTLERAKTVPMRLEITTIAGLDSEFPEGAESGFHTASESALLVAESTAKGAAPHLEVTATMRAGIPHEELVKASHGTDLVVIGSHKTSAVAGIVNGTLPLKVAGHAECPTVVVPVGWQPRRGDVVVGWSDDPTAEAALDFAAAEAVRTHEDLVIVHTWGSAPSAPMDGDGSAVLVQELGAAHRQLLADAAHRVEVAHPGLSVTQLLRAASAAVSIVRAAANASLVVVGSRGRGAVAGFLLGSVSHDVVVNMPAPVVVIPRKSAPVDVYPDLVDDEF